MLRAAAFAQVLGSPIGAYLLLHLDAAHLQLSIAGILTLVFLSMIVTPLQVKQFVQKHRQHLFSRADLQPGFAGYAPLANAPVTRDVFRKNWKAQPAADLELKGSVTTTGPKTVYSKSLIVTEKPGRDAALQEEDSGESSNSASSSLGNLAPMAPPPINIRRPSRTPSAQLPDRTASIQLPGTISNRSSMAGTPRWRSGSLPAASFHSEAVLSRLNAELAGSSIPAGQASLQGPPVVRISKDHLEMLKCDVASYHAASSAMSWTRRLQPDHRSVVINYPLDNDDIEAGTSLVPTPEPPSTPSRPSSPAIDWMTGGLLLCAPADPSHSVFCISTSWLTF